MEWSGAEWDGMEQSGMGWDRIIAQYNGEVWGGQQD